MPLWLPYTILAFSAAVSTLNSAGIQTAKYSLIIAVPIDPQCGEADCGSMGRALPEQWQSPDTYIVNNLESSHDSALTRSLLMSASTPEPHCWWQTFCCNLVSISLSFCHP